MSDVAIDWSSAEVMVRHESLELEVRLHPEADSFWANEFSRIRQSHWDETLHGGREGWWATASTFEKLTVGGIAPGSEETVRRELDAMVEEANRAAGEARRASAEQRQVEDEEARAREQTAREMTGRFRSGGS
jgi:hypothetical protein